MHGIEPRQTLERTLLATNRPRRRFSANICIIRKSIVSLLRLDEVGGLWPQAGKNILKVLISDKNSLKATRIVSNQLIALSL
jgi:hypothetical protein